MDNIEQHFTDRTQIAAMHVRAGGFSRAAEILRALADRLAAHGDAPAETSPANQGTRL